MSCSRRQLLLGALGVVVLPARGNGGAGSDAPQLLPTPAQVRGPFWPRPALRRRRFPRDADLDLAVVAGAPPAEGLRVVLQGAVLDVSGAPLAGAELEVWQTCSRGRYLHPGDRRSEVGEHDPGFQYFGTGAVGADGRWALRTVMPRSYPATSSRRWWRPPHVHFRVLLGGEAVLTTQMYFDDPLDPDNETTHRALQRLDRILGSVPPDRRAALVTRLGPGEAGEIEAVLRRGGLDPSSDPGGPGIPRLGTFDLVIDAASCR